MGLFWDYFRQTLRLPFIQAPGPLAMLADGGADALDAVRADSLTLRDQFFPSRCDDAYLVRFANSRGIVRAPLEPDEHWLERVRYAYRWWSRGGRESAIAEGLVVGYGFSRALITNLRAEDPARWASFRVVVQGGPGDILLRINSVRWAINEVKPARSLLAELKFYAEPLENARTFGVTTQTGHLTVVYPYAPTDLTAEFPILNHSATVINGMHTIIYPGDEV